MESTTGPVAGTLAVPEYSVRTTQPSPPMLAAIEITNEFYAGWGTLSLINAGLAQGKGRSGFNWFLLSLLLGPIATFALVALFDRRPQP